ncbi:MAG: efflux RND transporter periplasmic adaptor subunit [Candidatus Zixiibacteriota bacterium]
MRKLAIIPILILISIILIVLIYRRQQSDVLPENVIYSSGTVEANAVSVGAQTSGKVIAKRFAKGDQVKTGDTLLTIETGLLDAKQQELDATIAATRDEIAAARIELANVKTNLERMKEAYQVGSIPKRDYDNLQTAYDSGTRRLAGLESRLETIMAQQQTLDVQRGYTAIISPASGYVQADPIETGEIALIGTTLFEIVDLSDTWIEIYVNETDLPHLHLNDPAEVFLDSQPDSAVKGNISFISQKAEFTPKNVQTKKERIKLVFAVRIKVDNSSGAFKPGLPVDVYLKKS